MYTKDHKFNFNIDVPINKNMIISSKTFLKPFAIIFCVFFLFSNTLVFDACLIASKIRII